MPYVFAGAQTQERGVVSRTTPLVIVLCLPFPYFGFETRKPKRENSQKALIKSIHLCFHKKDKHNMNQNEP